MPQVLDIGVDLGTDSVVIYGKGKGIVLSEPAVIAVDRETRNVLAVGDEAHKMLGRTPGNISATRPLRDGMIADFELTATMLNYFVEKVIGRHMFGGPRVILALPAGVNEVERRSLTTSLFEAGARRTQLIDRPIAAAIGCGVQIGGADGSMVVDIGGGLAEIAVISMGRCVVRESCKTAGDALDDAIIRYVRRKHNLVIGEITAEDLKINIGCAMPRTEQLYMEIIGRDLITGLPKLMRINSDEVTEAIEEPLEALMESIHGVLEQTPAELAADIFDNGITLTGGGAQLGQLCEAVTHTLKVDCTVSETPRETVAIGCGMVLEHWSEFGQYIGNRKRGAGT